MAEIALTKCTGTFQMNLKTFMLSKIRSESESMNLMNPTQEYDIIRICHTVVKKTVS